MRRLATSSLLALLCAAQPDATLAELPRQPVITLSAARQIAAAAEAEAARLAAPGAAIAITDAGGNLVLLERLDNTFAAGSRVSWGKAKTAALFRKPTKAFEDAINGGRTAMAAMEDFTPLQGGVPIQIDGYIVGAIGVSGAMSADQDTAIAEAAARAAQSALGTGAR
jgi:uncharacterized protein GlcG (DUF336 family)